MASLPHLKHDPPSLAVLLCKARLAKFPLPSRMTAWMQRHAECRFNPRPTISPLRYRNIALTVTTRSCSSILARLFSTLIFHFPLNIGNRFRWFTRQRPIQLYVAQATLTLTDCLRILPMKSASSRLCHTTQLLCQPASMYMAHQKLSIEGLSWRQVNT